MSLRWRTDPVHYLRSYPDGSLEITFDAQLPDEWWVVIEGSRIVAFIQSASDAAHIVYVHNHWPGDDQVPA